jgi:hypothetical protein
MAHGVDLLLILTYFDDLQGAEKAASGAKAR